MKDFRTRLNGNYIFYANWKELYVLTEYWKSDLLFYKDDLMFLDRLIDKHILWISKEEDYEKVRSIEKNVAKTNDICISLLERVQKHLTHLSDFMINPFVYDEQKFREEHQQLEDDITEFIKTYRTNKKEVFEVSKHLIESDELIRILTKSS